jgi:hypothetical protein
LEPNKINDNENDIEGWRQGRRGDEWRRRRVRERETVLGGNYAGSLDAFV